MPIRILHVVGGGLVRGGTETLLMNVLRHIDRERYRMDFLVHTSEPQAYDDEVRALGSRIIPCAGPGHPSAYARRFRRVLREQGPYDVVHGHAYLFNGLPLWLAAGAGVPGRIAHIHPLADIEAQGARRAVLRAVATRLIARSATMIVASSQSTLAAFRGVCRFRQPARILYAGIDLAPFNVPVDRDAVRARLGLPADRPLITYVARFVPHKNHAQVLRVADRLAAAGVPAHFALAGSHGPVLPELRKSAAERDDLSLVIGLPELADLLLASDIFFFPSLEEGFGIVAVEAGAAGLPVVASSLPSIREALAPSHHALMFPPDDDAAATDRLTRLLADPGLRSTLSADARQWATNFSIERATARFTAVYRRYGRSLGHERTTVRAI